MSSWGGVSLVIDKGTTKRDWKKMGFSVVSRSVEAKFKEADWLAFGIDVLELSVKEISAFTGMTEYRITSLANMSRRIPDCNRTLSLTWSHYRAVVMYKPDEQRVFLEWAVDKNASVSEMNYRTGYWVRCECGQGAILGDIGMRAHLSSSPAHRRNKIGRDIPGYVWVVIHGNSPSLYGRADHMKSVLLRKIKRLVNASEMNDSAKTALLHTVSNKKIDIALELWNDMSPEEPMTIFQRKVNYPKAQTERSVD